MAKKEEVVLDLSVDQGSMISELERTKKVIIGLKEEQQALNKAYKAGEITQEEYAKELVRVDSLLKTSQATYNNTQKAVTGVKTKMDDLIASNNKLADSVKTSTENIRVAGVSVGDLGTKFASLANPVTAAVAVVGALGVAYARSANGAKDLEFAQTQLSAAFGLLSNDLSNLVGASGEDGEGLLTKFLNTALKLSVVGITDKLGLTNIVEGSKEIALANERLEDLLREELSIRATIGDRIADNQEIMSVIQDSQTKFNEKLELTFQITKNITKNEDELIAVKQKQIAELEEQRKSAKDVEAIDTKILEIGRDISNVQKDAERRRQAVVRLESNLKDGEQKRLETIKKQNEALQEQKEKTDRIIKAKDEADARELFEREVSFDDDPIKSEEFDIEKFLEEDKALIDETLGLTKTAEDEKRAELLRTNALKDELQQEDRRRFEESAQMMEDNFNTLAGLFSQGSEARKLFALAGIGADTASAIASLTAMSEANPANAFTFGGAGIAQYAAGIVRILANIVAAKEFLGGSFAGGADFVTTKPTMIMVGDNPGHRERVTVEPLSGRGKSSYNPRSGLARFAGGGSMTFDGQSTTATRTINETLAASNALKSMPTPEVSVKEITKVQKRIRVKENISRA